jgi:predicted RNase H-like HicB family nuclease
MQNPYQIRAVVLQEGDWWVAQCLDYDIATQAKTIAELYDELERVLMGHMVMAREAGVAPFSGIPRAPKRYWDLFRDARLKLEPVEPPVQLDVPSPSVDLRAAA